MAIQMFLSSMWNELRHFHLLFLYFIYILIFDILYLHVFTEEIALWFHHLYRLPQMDAKRGVYLSVWLISLSLISSTFSHVR